VCERVCVCVCVRCASVCLMCVCVCVCVCVCDFCDVWVCFVVWVPFFGDWDGGIAGVCCECGVVL